MSETQQSNTGRASLKSDVDYSHATYVVQPQREPLLISPWFAYSAGIRLKTCRTLEDCSNSFRHWESRSDTHQYFSLFDRRKLRYLLEHLPDSNAKCCDLIQGALVLLALEMILIFGPFVRKFDVISSAALDKAGSTSLLSHLIVFIMEILVHGFRSKISLAAKIDGLCYKFCFHASGFEEKNLNTGFPIPMFCGIHGYIYSDVRSLAISVVQE